MDPTERIDSYIDGLAGWQRDYARHLREQIHAADSQIAEDWKWDTPVFTARGKQVCAIGAFKDTFMTGADYAKWVEKEEKVHFDLMKEAGFLSKP